MIERAPGLRPEDLVPDDAPEETQWLESAWRAAIGTATEEPSDIASALASNLLRGFHGWPEPKEMGGFTALSRYSPEEILAVRQDTRELLLRVIDDAFAPYRRKRFAVLALCNLCALGVGDAETLRRCDRLPWLTPSLREYLRDALTGLGGRSLGGAPQERNQGVEDEIAQADPPASDVLARAEECTPTGARPPDPADATEYAAAPEAEDPPGDPKAGSVDSRHPQGKEDLALAHLTRAIREKRPIPSKAECARAAGATPQATAKWHMFNAAWVRAKTTERASVRRPYRNIRHGGVRPEDDPE